VIWIKTDAGRVEMQARSLVKERPQRTLLLLIDGTKSDDMLLASVAGVRAEDFKTLQDLGLIAPAPSALHPGSSARAAPTSPAPLDAPGSTRPAPLDAVRETDYAQFTTTLTQLISKELGLRGFTLTLAVERAGTIAELQAVAQRTLDQIRDRKGEAVASAARRALYGA
jgi:hypothetical protein